MATVENLRLHQRKHGCVNAGSQTKAGFAVIAVSRHRQRHGYVAVGRQMKVSFAAIAERQGNKNGSYQF